MNDFFHFSLFERKGIGTLLVCLVLLTWLPRHWSERKPPQEELTWEVVPAPTQIRQPASKERAPSPRRDDTLVLREFDPNTITYDALTEMGLPSGLAKGWVNYRAAGAHFRYRQDLLRLYQMDSAVFVQLEPYINLPDRPARDSVSLPTSYSRAPNSSPVVISINRATPGEWAKLRGIGPVLSNRIVTFRDKLGGFATVGQVSETFGLPDSTFQRIVTKLRMDDPPARLPVNTLSVEQLAGHPYISWKQAKAVVSFRTNHGPYSSLADFQVLRIFTSEEHRRLVPYLDFSTLPDKRSGKTESPATVQ